MHMTNQDPDSTGTWMSYITEPDVDAMEEAIERGESPHLGPYIYVAGFTGDLEAHEQQLREVWDGPLCVCQQERTTTELRRIQDELSDEAIARELGIQTTLSSDNVWLNQVEQGVVIATPEMEQAVVDRFGEGAVKLFPEFEPIAP